MERRESMGVLTPASIDPIYDVRLDPRDRSSFQPRATIFH